MRARERRRQRQSADRVKTEGAQKVADASESMKQRAEKHT